MLSTYVFDAYGTLFDVHAAIGRHRDAAGADAENLSQTLANEAARIYLDTDARRPLFRFLDV